MIEATYKQGQYLIRKRKPSYDDIVKIMEVRFYSDHPNLWLSYSDTYIYYCVQGTDKSKTTPIFILDEDIIKKDYAVIDIKDKNLKLLYE